MLDSVERLIWSSSLLSASQHAIATYQPSREDEKASAGEMPLPTGRDLEAGQQLRPGEQMNLEKHVKASTTYRG
jgi:hypothetical protein